MIFQKFLFESAATRRRSFSFTSDLLSLVTPGGLPTPAEIYWRTYVLLSHLIMGRRVEPDLQLAWHLDPHAAKWVRWFYGYGEQESRVGWFNAKDAKKPAALFYEAAVMYHHLAMTRTLEERKLRHRCPLEGAGLLPRPPPEQHRVSPPGLLPPDVPEGRNPRRGGGYRPAAG